MESGRPCPQRLTCNSVRVMGKVEDVVFDRRWERMTLSMIATEEERSSGACARKLPRAIITIILILIKIIK